MIIKSFETFEIEDLKFLFDELKEKFAKKHLYLIQNQLNERTVAGAMMLEFNLILNDNEGIFADIEYNKNSLDTETFNKVLKVHNINVSCNGKSIKKPKVFESEYKEHSFFPDIIIHSRGNGNNNYAIIEVKKSEASFIDKEKDLYKLSLIKDAFDQKYKYYVYLEYSLENNDLKFDIYYLDYVADDYIFKKL